VAMSQKPDLKTIESYDVSFIEIRANGKWLETGVNVATAINVEFAGSSRQSPFVLLRAFLSLCKILH
jgi:hypothetical protein